MAAEGRTDGPDGGQLLHGLTIVGSVDLGGAPAPAGRPADFGVVVTPSGPVPHDELPGDRVAELDIPGTKYEAALEGQRLRVRFHDTAEFDIDLDSGAIVAAPAPGREGMIPVLLGGSVLALILGLKGAPVLHASVVTAGDSAIAITGPSGAGKSTLAFLLCGLGMRLLTDDTARVAREGSGWQVHRGGTTLRLRGPAAEVADRPGWSHYETVDGRTAVRPPSAPEALSALGAILVPHWSESIDAPTASPLGQRDLTAALLRSQRVSGWRAPGPLETNFQCCADIPRAVPAFRLDVPRGKLDDPGLPGAISAALAAAVGGETA